MEKLHFTVRNWIYGKRRIGQKLATGNHSSGYNLPERFELEYIGADNSTHRPIMIHRAPFEAWNDLSLFYWNIRRRFPYGLRQIK